MPRKKLRIRSKFKKKKKQRKNRLITERTDSEIKNWKKEDTDIYKDLT